MYVDCHTAVRNEHKQNIRQNKNRRKNLGRNNFGERLKTRQFLAQGGHFLDLLYFLGLL